MALVWVFAGAPAFARVESTSEGIRFSYANANAKSVFLGGDFNGWSATAQPMARVGETFTAVVRLDPGEHEYKFVVDGQWFADPDNPVTLGSYGNSGLRVGDKGELVTLQATSNSALSPKLMLTGRTIGLFIGRRDETNGNRFGVGRPDFNIDLDFNLRMSSALDARVLTKVRNASEGTPLWETSLRFDRGHMELHRENVVLRLFDNDGAGTWTDPLHLVGDMGPYRRDFGYQQQGMRVIGNWKGVRSTFLYADNFEAGDPTPPQLDTLAVSSVGRRYDFTRGDTNENVLALRLERDLGRSMVLGAGLRNDRGANPGNLSRVQVVDDTTRTREAFGRTDETWLGGGLDLRITRGAGWEAVGQWLYGEASIRTGPGVRQTYRAAGTSFVRTGEQTLGSDRVGMDVSQRWTLGGRATVWRDFVLHASVERERHGLADIANDSLRAVRNAATIYRGGADVELYRRLNIPVRLGLGVEAYDFSYSPGAPWNTQLWFSDRNFWIDHFEDRLPVTQFVQLGGGNATTWRPWLEWKLWAGPPLTFRYDGVIRGTAIDHAPKLWESFFKVRYPVTKRLTLTSDTRWARYSDRVLSVHGGWVSTFAEGAYSFADGISVALSWGVDPSILDVVTNEYDSIGRNEFLIARGATVAVARDRYLNLGAILPRAEKALADERRVQVEVIVKF